MTEGDCAGMEIQLSAWIDGELDASAAAEVREHLAGCASCRRRHAVLAAASTAVRRLPAETVSAGFEDAFRRRLATARAEAARPRRRPTTAAAAAGVAAVLVLALLGSFALRRAAMPGAAPTAASGGAPTAGECLPDSPCASATACGFVVPAEAPCASAATCGPRGSRSRTREGS